MQKDPEEPPIIVILKIMTFSQNDKTNYHVINEMLSYTSLLPPWKTPQNAPRGSRLPLS